MSGHRQPPSRYYGLWYAIIPICQATLRCGSLTSPASDNLVRFTQPPMISDNLRSQADHFIFLSLCAVSLTDTRQNICRVRPRRSPIKPRSMPAFRRRKLSENRLLAPSGPEFRPSFEDAMAKQLNNARDVDRVSNIRDSQSLFSSAKLIALPNLPRRRAEFPGLRPRPDRQPQGDCWGSRHVSSS